MLKGLRQAVEHEIKIGIGTDAAMSYVTHYDMWRELDHYMRQTKLNAGQVIERVTKNEEILGIDHLTGSIDIGKQADLIVLEHNPLDNIKALSNVAMVMVRGNLIQTPSVTRIQEVDELLDSVW
nr:amidohydrolase family protein [Paenibacillus sp. AK121]